MLYYITGGERSGKSAYAQKLALGLSDAPVYLATARILDEDFRKRVEFHKSDRDSCWTNMEEEKCLSQLELKGRVVVIDCVTMWLANFYQDNGNDQEKSLAGIKSEFDKLMMIEATFIIVSNEIGMGVHATTELARKFTELQGWANQYIASKADKALLMVSGLPLSLK